MGQIEFPGGKPRLVVQQKITPFVNRYKVFFANEDGTTGPLAAFAQQKRLALKEKVTFFTDESKSETVFSFRAEKIIDLHGRYFIEDSEGKLLGSFKKHFKESLVNSTWTMSDDAGQERLRLKESNSTLAALRRVAGFLPIVGEIGDLVMGLFRYHFLFLDMATGNEVGRYIKTTLVRDHYQLRMTEEEWAKADWRVMAAMGVALDALQSR